MLSFSSLSFLISDINMIFSLYWFRKVPDIIDNAYVIVEFENGSRGMLDLCMFAEGSKNEQEISVVGDVGKVNPSFPYHNKYLL